jgi:FAD/FMN-containing dehydrogenase
VSGLAPALVLPGDPGWEHASLGHRPAAIAFPTSADDVAALAEHAAREGLRLVARCTGHAAPGGPLHDALLVRTTGLGDLTVDPGRARARVGAGVLWGELEAAAAEHGLTARPTAPPFAGVVESRPQGRVLQEVGGIVLAMEVELHPVALRDWRGDEPRHHP